MKQKKLFLDPGELRKDDYYRHDEYLLDGVEVLPTTPWTIYKEVKNGALVQMMFISQLEDFRFQPLIFRGECIDERTWIFFLKCFFQSFKKGDPFLVSKEIPAKEKIACSSLETKN